MIYSLKQDYPNDKQYSDTYDKIMLKIQEINKKEFKIIEIEIQPLKSMVEVIKCLVENDQYNMVLFKSEINTIINEIVDNKIISK